MDLETYQQGWEKASPLMRQKLDAIEALLVINGFLTETDKAGDEEWRLDCAVRYGSTLRGGIEFTLHEDDDGSANFGIGCRLFGPDAKVHGGWTPFAYTGQAFAPIDEIIQRIESFDPEAFVAFALPVLLCPAEEGR